jgi:probable F420-dependent oxidoreductase
VVRDRRFRFALQVFHASTGADWARLVQRTEEYGYDVISMPDHFDGQFAPIPGLAAAASATNRAHLSMFVLANDFHIPAVLAKEAATLDVLSDGRLELGIGAGWNAAEFEQAGLLFDPPATRIDRLREAIVVVKQLFAGGPVEHHGAYYTINGLELFPRPVRPTGIPLVVGGGGPKMLELAAQEADTVAITTDNRNRTAAGFMGERSKLDTVRAQVECVRQHAGARFNDLELNARVITVAVTDERDAVARELAGVEGLAAEELLESPYALIGTVSQIVDQLRRLRDELAISYFTISQDSASDFAPVVARLRGT